jgi:Kelch motif
MKPTIEKILSEVGTLVVSYMDINDVINSFTYTSKFIDGIVEFSSKILLRDFDYPWISVYHKKQNTGVQVKGFYKKFLYLITRKGAMIIGGSVDSRRCRFFSTKTQRFLSMDYMSTKGDTMNSTAVWHRGRMFVFSCHTEAVTGSLEIYNPVLTVWSKSARGLPIIIKSAAAASCQNHLYVLGGDHFCKPQWKKSDRIFYLSNESTENEQHYHWTKVGVSLLRGRMFHAAADYKGKIWIAGGLLEKRTGDIYNDLCTRSVEIFDPLTGTVVQGPEMLHTRFQSTLAVIRGSLWVIGGDVHQTERTVGTVERFNGDLGCWEFVTVFPKRREGCAICAIDSIIYVFGGYVGCHSFNDWDAYDVTTGRWLSEDDIQTSATNTFSVGTGTVYNTPQSKRLVFPVGACPARNSMNMLNGATAVATCPS